MKDLIFILYRFLFKSSIFLILFFIFFIFFIRRWVELCFLFSFICEWTWTFSYWEKKSKARKKKRAHFSRYIYCHICWYTFWLSRLNCFAFTWRNDDNFVKLVEFVWIVELIRALKLNTEYIYIFIYMCIDMFFFA